MYTVDMKTIDVIKDVIQKKGLSYNHVILMTGIDRSSFFQILKGKRRPTPEQIMHFIQAAAPEEEDTLKILELYEEERTGKEKTEDRKALHAFLSRLDHPSCPSSSSCPVEIMQALDQTEHIQLCLPFSLFLKFSLPSALSSRSVKTEILCPVSDDSDPYDAFHRILSLFSFIPYMDLTLSSMKEEDEIPVALYPYYILTDHDLILIREDGEELIPVKEEKLISSYRNNFSSLSLKSDPVLIRHKGMSSLIERMSEIYSSRTEKEIYMIEPRPCVMLTADDALIQKYTGSEELLAYHHLIEKLNIKEFTVPSGMHALLEEKQISENGFHASLSDEDIPFIKQRLADRISHNLFFFNEHYLTIPAKWTIGILSPQEIFIGPYDSSNFTVFIHDPRITSIFHAWISSRTETVNPDLLISDHT